MNRNIDIEVDTDSWKREGDFATGSNQEQVPPEVSALDGLKWSSNVLTALVHTALCTRPPVVQGFHLSDFWAWLRYAWAISETEDLRLQAAWESVDPHQKTVLSDELGIGFTTSFIREKLGCLDFTDTLHFVNVLEPGKLSLKPSAKTGPKKSPDYIGREPNGAYCVLECKGTQRSRQSLAKAIDGGKSQKKNLRTTQGGQISHSLVAGLFIPQWSCSEDACIRIADPTRDELENLLINRSPRDVDTSIVQLSLAKNLSLAGFRDTAEALAETSSGALRSLPDAARRELGRRFRAADRTSPETGLGKLDLAFDTDRLRSPDRSSTPRPMRGRFWVQVPEDALERLHDSDAVADLLAELADNSRKSGWKVQEADMRTDVITPLGFRYRIELTHSPSGASQPAGGSPLVTA